MNPNRRALHRGAYLLGIAVLVGLPWVLSTRDLHFAIELLIAGLFAMSLGMIMGQGGMVSLGHAAFFSIGGYTAGLLLKAGVDFSLAMTAAPLAAAAAGWLMGFLAVRRSHAYLLMLTFALGQLVYSVFFSWRSLTGGDDGLIGIRPPGWLIPLENFYWFSLALTGVSIFVLFRIFQSPFGYSLRAVRDSPNRAIASGIPVRRQQIMAFVIGAFFAGIAGALFAFFNRAFFPGSAHWLHSADAFVAVIVGGPMLSFGPLVGAVILEFLSEFISRYTVYRFLFLGAAMIFIALVAPYGVGPPFMRLIARIWQPAKTDSEEPQVPAPLGRPSPEHKEGEAA